MILNGLPQRDGLAQLTVFGGILHPFVRLSWIRRGEPLAAANTAPVLRSLLIVTSIGCRALHPRFQRGGRARRSTATHRGALGFRGLSKICSWRVRSGTLPPCHWGRFPAASILFGLCASCCP